MSKIIRDLTPEGMKCAFSMSCPAVFELHDGRIAVIGEIADTELLAELEDRIGPNEEAVVISRALLADVFPEGTIKDAIVRLEAASAALVKAMAEFKNETTENRN